MSRVASGSMTRRRRTSLFGPSRAVLMLALCLAGTARSALAEISDPEAPIATNRYRGIDASSGGPGEDAEAPSPLTGAPARDDLERGTARPPAFRTTGLAAGAPGLPASPSASSPPPAAEAAEDRAEPVSGETAPPVAAIVATTAASTQSTSSQPRVYSPIDASLSLNGRFLGVISTDVDLRGDGLVDGARLLALLEPAIGAELMAKLRAAVAGREKAPYGDLAIDGFKLTFDTSSLELKAETGVGSLAENDLSLSGAPPVPDPGEFPDPAPFSAGVNVTMAQRYLHEGEGWAPLRGAVDAILHFGGFTGLTLIAGADYDEGAPDGPWRRREARLIKDFYSTAIRATAGEFTPVVDSFQGSGRIVGVGVERSYATIRPFQNIRPTGRQEFTLERETTVEVIINGVPGQTLRLQPGRYSLADFPFATGANVVQLVTDDATGRRELAVFDVFSGSDLLGDGVLEFGVAAGQYEGSGAFEYDGPWLATGFVRKGLSDAWTVGANAQVSEEAGQVGGTAIWGSRYGLVLAELAASWSRMRDAGFAAGLSYRKDFSFSTPNDVRVTGTALYTSEDFGDAFQPTAFNSVAFRAGGLVQWQGPFDTGLSLGAGWSKGRSSNPDQSQLDFTISRAFGRITAVATASYLQRDPGDSETRIGFSLTAPLGPRWTSGARYDSENNRTEVYLSRYSDGGIDDLSGELRVINDDRNRDITGRLDYVNNRFEAELVHNRAYDLSSGGDESAETSLVASTFFGFAGGRFGLGRPIEDAFIIAPVHKSLGETRVELLSGSEPIARNGWFGPPVVPIRRAYGVNTYGIEVDPLPAGYDLGSGALTVFPPYGAGYVLPIGSDASRIAIGVLSGPAGPLALATGTIERIGADDGEGRPFFTNRQGRFVADRLAPGRYRVIIGGAAVAEFEIPEDSEGVVNVGALQTSGG